MPPLRRPLGYGLALKERSPPSKTLSQIWTFAGNCSDNRSHLSEPTLQKRYDKPLGSSSNALVSTWFLEPDDSLNDVKALGSRLQYAAFPNTSSEGRRTWIPHASHHYSSRSAARRRRLVRSWTLVLGAAHELRRIFGD